MKNIRWYGTFCQGFSAFNITSFRCCKIHMYLRIQSVNEILYWQQPPIVLAAASYCTGSSLVLYWQQPPIVLAAASYCTGRSLLLYWQQPPIVLAAASYCIGSSLLLYWQPPPIVLAEASYCTGSSLLLGSGSNNVVGGSF